MSSHDPLMYRLWNAIVHTTVAVVGLLVLRVVLLKLPMLQDIPVGSLPVELGELLALVATTAIFLAVLIFGRQLSSLTAGMAGAASVAGQLGEYGLDLAVVVLAYKAYQEVMLGLLVGQEWVYHTAFIVLGIVPVCGIALVTYRNLDLLTSAIIRVFRSRETRPAVLCLECRQPIPMNAAFCANCGARRPAEPADGARVCRKCTAALKPNEKFCPHCGEAAAEVAQSPSARACPHCQSPMSVDAAFCPACGSSPEGGAPSPAAVSLPQCEQCGQPLSASAKFCAHCGAAVAGTRA